MKNLSKKRSFVTFFFLSKVLFVLLFLTEIYRFLTEIYRFLKISFFQPTKFLLKKFFKIFQSNSFNVFFFNFSFWSFTKKKTKERKKEERRLVDFVMNFWNLKIGMIIDELEFQMVWIQIERNKKRRRRKKFFHFLVEDLIFGKDEVD